MFWDGVIALLVGLLAFSGYKRGLVESWTGIPAMVAATLIVQHFYIDFSTWVMSHLRTSPQASVLIGYLILWLCIENACELLLNNFFRKKEARAPMLIDQIFGLGYGLLKGSLVVLLPIMAVSVPIKIPPPPADQSGLINPIVANTDSAVLLLPTYRDIAERLMPVVDKYVTSENPPSFTPDFSVTKEKKEE